MSLGSYGGVCQLFLSSFGGTNCEISSVHLSIFRML